MMRTREISWWTTPATSYMPDTVGRAAVVNVAYKRGFYAAYQTGPECDKPGYDFYYLDRRTTITTLQIDGRTVMVDDPPHWWAMQAHASAYQGRVLVAGLGLGLILHALLDKPAVTHITVIEREPDVVQLVSPFLLRQYGAAYLAKKCMIIQTDWEDYLTPWMPEQYNGVFYDLLVGDGRALFPFALRTMIELVRQFGEKPIRIHGYNNDHLRRIAESAITCDSTQQP